MPKQFNDGIIDLSSLREKKQAQKQAKKEALFDSQAIMASIPAGYNVTDEEGNPAKLMTQNVIVTVDNVFLIMTEEADEEKLPFLMVAKHENNAINDNTLRPPTQEEFNECQTILAQAALVHQGQQGATIDTEETAEKVEEVASDAAQKEELKSLIQED